MLGSLGLLVLKILISGITLGDSFVGVSIAGLICLGMYFSDKERERSIKNDTDVAEIKASIAQLTVEMHSLKTQIGFSRGVASKPVQVENAPQKRYF